VNKRIAKKVMKIPWRYNGGQVRAAAKRLKVWRQWYLGVQSWAKILEDDFWSFEQMNPRRRFPYCRFFRSNTK